MTAFPIDPALQDHFLRAKADPSVRGLVICIKDEHVVFKDTISSSTNVFSDDLCAVGGHCTVDPCYVLLRLPQECDWGLVAYVPDTCHVKQRMLYGATTKSIATGFNTTASAHCSDAADVTPSSLLAAFTVRAKAEDAMTAAELEKKVEKAAVAAPSGVTSVEFKWDAQAEDAVKTVSTMPVVDAAFAGIDAVVALAMVKEVVSVDLTVPSPLSSASSTPLKADSVMSSGCSAPRYLLCRVRNAAGSTAAVLVYCCPGMSVIKDRMVYASAKGAVVSRISSLLAAAGGAVSAVTKAIEFGDYADVDNADIVSASGLDILDAPSASQSEDTMGGGAESALRSRPKRAGRGAARLVS